MNGAVGVSWITGTTPTSARWAQGIGKIGIVATAAAIANGVHHATRGRVHYLPLTLDKLLPARRSRARSPAR